VVEGLQVEAQTAAGGLRPLAFTLNGLRRTISDWGRKWRQGDEIHYLVMTRPGSVFELVYQPLAGNWRLARRPRSFLQPDPAA